MLQSLQTLFLFKLKFSAEFRNEKTTQVLISFDVTVSRVNCIYESWQKYSHTFVQHFRKIKPVLVLGKKKKLRPTNIYTKYEYNGRAPGLHPDYFCIEISFAIFKDLDDHSAERNKLDSTNFHTIIVRAKLVFCSYPSIYDNYFSLCGGK